MRGIRIALPREISRIGEKIASSGGKAYLVGGALRDRYLRRDVSGDFDLATSLSPERIMELFPRTVPTGIKHGTVTVLSGAYSVEITTLRLDESYTDGRRPASVSFTDDIKADLSRRDFTMNALALDLETGEFHDPFEGEKDIRDRIIRTVGNPDGRFSEDGLRPLRAVRFASQLGFEIDTATFSAIPRHIATFRRVSSERVRDELKKILLSARPGRGLQLLDESGLLDEILPELAPSRGFEQGGRHKYTVLEHLFRSVDAAVPDLVVRAAALFHDAGKPASFAQDAEGCPSFHGHEKLSAELAGKAMRRLKFTNEEIESTVHLVRHHMFNYTDGWSDAAVRRFIARVGSPSIDRLLRLRMADSSAIDGSAPSIAPLETFITRIRAALAEPSALTVRDLAIGGEDLARLGFPKGPLMGRALADLLETVLDDPEQNSRERLEKIATGLKIRYGI